MPYERNKTVEINDLQKRMTRVENIVFTEDNIETAKALSKGAVQGTVDLYAEMVDLKHQLTCIKEKLNEVILWLNSKL